MPPHIQRARAEDLLAAVFPAQVGLPGQPRRRGDRAADHPLVNETLQGLSARGARRRGTQGGAARASAPERSRTIARDLPEPSPLAHALLNSQPYTFLDDAPLEERRARAVQVRRSLPAEDAAGLGALDAAAIEQVVADARPLMRDAEELHDWLLSRRCWCPAEGVAADLLAELAGYRPRAALRLAVDEVERS